jgi:Zn-dependent M28 family amino/carboxypeptidase
VDDGAGVYAAAGVIEVLRQLNLRPRRTIRFVAWTNEENGGRGGKAYAAALSGNADKQIAAIESDEGGGRALGISAAVKPESLAALRPVIDALRAEKISIREVKEARISLEDLFLSAVNSDGKESGR